MIKMEKVIIVVFMTLAEIGYCQDVYVSPSGDNSNTGTADKPLATLQAAYDMARNSKGNIILKSGTYYLKSPLLFKSGSSGSANTPLLIKGEGGGKSILSGGIKIEGFKKASNSLWVAEKL
jgi:hypothetical protein